VHPTYTRSDQGKPGTPRRSVPRSRDDSISVSPPLKRYNLAVPQNLFDDLQRLADERNTTVVELLRKFIKLGLLAAQVEDTPGSALIIREGDRERELIFI
jgi:hypothetical protein